MNTSINYTFEKTRLLRSHVGQQAIGKKENMLDQKVREVAGPQLRNLCLCVAGTCLGMLLTPIVPINGILLFSVSGISAITISILILKNNSTIFPKIVLDEQKNQADSGLIDPYLDISNTKSLKMTIKEIKEESDEKVKILEKYSKDFPQDFIDGLTKIISSITTENLSKLLLDPQFKNKKMQTTLIMACKEVEDRVSKKNTNIFHSKKTRKSYGFIIDENNKIHIRVKKIAYGSSKIFNASLCVQDYDDNYVQGSTKKDVEDENEIINESKWFELFKGVGVMSPFIFNGKTTRKLNSNSKYSRVREVLLQKKMEGDGYQLIGQPVQVLKQAVIDLLTGLNRIHTKGYVHNDIKNYNILVDKHGKVYLTDFGFVENIGTHIKCGSLGYLPPELFPTKNSMEVDWKRFPSQDCWGLGVALFELICPNEFNKKSPSFNVQASQDTIGQLSKYKLNRYLERAKKNIEKDNLLLNEDKKMKLQMFEVIRGFLQYDAKDRISCVDALKIMK